MDAITLHWDHADPAEEVTHYIVEGTADAPTTVPADADADPFDDGFTFIDDDFDSDGIDVPPIFSGHARSYQIRAVNATGKSERSETVTMTTFLGCVPPGVCYGNHPLTRLHTVGYPSGAVPANGSIELGRLRVDTDLTYAEQTIAYPRADGIPGPEILNASIGPLTVSYSPHVTLGAPIVLDPEGPDFTTVASIWAGRFWVYAGPEKITDLPVVIIQPRPIPDG